MQYRITSFQTLELQQVDDIRFDIARLHTFLADRDKYYRTIYDYASSCMSRYDAVCKERDEAILECERIKLSLENLKDRYKKQQSELSKLQQSQKELKGILSKYTDDIAKKVLEDDPTALFRSEGIVSDMAAEKTIFGYHSSISDTNNVVQELADNFDDFGGDY